MEATLEIGYSFKGGGSIKENIDVTILVEYILDELYSVEEAYRSDVSDTTEDESEE